MKKANIFIAAFSIIALVCFTACKKSKDKPAAVSTETNTDRLCGKNFILTGWKSSPALQGHTDIYEGIRECALDNTMRFDVNGTVLYDEGVKCDSIVPQTESRTWKFANNETEIIINVAEEYKILVNDGINLKLTMSQVLSDTTYLFTLTYKKQ